MKNIKCILLCAIVSSLSMAACVAGETDADLDDAEQIGEGAEAVCSAILMPVAQATRVVSGAGTYDDETVVSPSAGSYTVDFSMPVGKPGMFASAEWAGAVPTTQAQCEAASLSLSVWRRDFFTGCWSFVSSKTVNGSWTSSPGTLFPCTFPPSLFDVSTAVSSNTTVLKVKGTAKIGSTLKPVGVRAGWSEPADVPR